MSQKIHLAKMKIARRAAHELQNAGVVNLGVGIPTMIPDFLQTENTVFLHSENGLLGMGPTPKEENIDMDLISASKHPVSYTKGAALFSSDQSFAMIRGGHIDVAVMGALQVCETGEIANWSIPGANILGVGGAMDLVVGANRLIITMTHQTKEGKPKLVRELSYPKSGLRTADMVITEKAVFVFQNNAMILKEIAEESDLTELRKKTDARFEAMENVPKF